MHADREVARIAARQHGVITRDQLTSLGLGRGAVAHRLDAGRLHRVHRGVYRVGHATPLPYSREAAAILACAPRAAVSHRDAAALLDLLEPVDGDVHVTVVSRNCQARQGIVVHRAQELDVVKRHGIPVTSPLRTLLDISRTASAWDLEHAVDEALVQRMVDPDDLIRSPRIRRLLELQAGPSITKGEAERRMRRLIRDAKLPPGIHNTKVAGRHVDVFWPPALAVEVDSFKFHGTTPRKFRNDRDKEDALDRVGVKLIRVTWWQITDEPLAVATRLAYAMARGVPSPAPSHSRP